MVPESPCGELIDRLVGSGNGRSVGIEDSAENAFDESRKSSRLAALFLPSPPGGYKYP